MGRINKMLSCAGADRLQSGMRGAFGKAYGKACRVKIGDPLISIRTHAKWIPACLEALRRAKMKFPGRQKIAISRLVGFTKYTREQIDEMEEQGRLRTEEVTLRIEDNTVDCVILCHTYLLKNKKNIISLFEVHSSQTLRSNL